MGYQTGLARALAARGLTVEVVPGWQTRGSSAFHPKGAVCHWTAGPRTGDRPSLKVVRDGRADLPGPLANVFLARSGVAIVVTAGRANHAGVGGARGLEGNSQVFGTEAESAGDGDWTDAQRWAYPRINAAYCDLAGFGPDFVFGHNEWAPNRKIDIRDWTMARMRREVAALLTQEDEMSQKAERQIDALYQAMFYGSLAGGVRYPGMLPILAETQKRVTETPAKVWATPVQRTNGPVSALQDLANGTTNATAAAAQIAGLRVALTQLAEGRDVDLDAIEERMRDVLATSVVKVEISVPAPAPQLAPADVVDVVDVDALTKED